MLRNDSILAAATMEGRTIKAEFDSHTGERQGFCSTALLAIMMSTRSREDAYGKF
ncbi:hypothetical protein OKW37_001738 [Paraburkholderia sp. MM5482-R2]